MENRLLWGLVLGGVLLLIVGLIVLGMLSTELNGTRWRLVALQHSNGSVLWTSNAMDQFTLQFQMNQLGGRGACNVYGAQYGLNRFTRSIWVRDLIQTLVACSPVSDMEREGQFLDALSKAQRYELMGNQLRIYADMDRVLVFERAE